MSRSQKQSRPRPLALVMLEGWGIAPVNDGNAIAAAAPEYFNHIISHYPATVLEASGESVSLDAIQSGSSEIGHTIIGSGRHWHSSRRYIEEQIATGNFGASAGFTKLKKKLLDLKGRVHLIGLLSDSNQLSSIQFLKALVRWCAEEKISEVNIHGILDGRDCAATAGQRLVEDLQEFCAGYRGVALRSLVGRFYALDEKHNQARLEKAFNLFAHGSGNVAVDTSVLSLAYEKKIFDEEFPPTLIGSPANGIDDNDIVIFWHHEGQSLNPLIQYFSSTRPKIALATLTDYGSDQKVTVLQPTPKINSSLTSLINEAGWRQLRLSDSAGFPGVSKWLDAGQLQHQRT